MQQKSLNDIIPPSKRRTMGDMAPIPPAGTPGGEMPTLSKPRGKRRFPVGTALIALIVIALSAGALYAFGGARVEVTPFANDAYVSSEFTATASSGDLPFEVISVEKIASKSVPAESTENANDAAQGTITIYNEQGSAQTLIRNTRFESPDGLIFRIRDSVSVPAGSQGSPGSVSVTVYADEAGERYNIGPADFTVPGLQGSSAFDAVYAKSSEAMMGGFTGTRPSVSQATRDREAGALQGGLTSELESELQAQIPEGYILVPGASFTNYEQLPPASGATGSVDVRVRGSAQAVVFPNHALAKAIAYLSVGSYTGQPLSITDASRLLLTPSEGAQAPVGAETFTFSLSGQATLVWDIDQDRIAGAVAGKTRDSAQVVLSGFPEIDTARLILRPFWSSTFPEDPAKITVDVKR